ncbi:MAG TPA: MFS transporter [Streptosporangiaceae bacterium]|nr:MFS transporter [Streptosporangiaceae bacterium]
MADAPAPGADQRGAGDPTPGGADPGEAEQGGLGVFRSLRRRNYRLFASGQIVSNTGTWMQRVAQDWLVLELTHNNGLALGITTGLQFLPLLVFGLWGGVIADRYDKRRVLMFTQTIMGSLALLLGGLVLGGVVQVWMVYGLAFALGMATVVDNPTRQTFVVEMVGKADLPNAIALNSAIFNSARILGPAVAGLSIALLGTGPVFLVNAASYAAVLTGLALMRVGELHRGDPVGRAKGQLRAGLRYVRARRDLVLILILVGFVAAFGMNFQLTTALVSREVFHTGASAFGLASTMLAVGALTGSLLAARRAKPPRSLLPIAALSFGLLEIVSGLMPTYASFIVLLVPTGMALLTFNTAANATMQLSVSPEMRGRVMGLYMLVFAGTAPLGSPAIGWLAEQLGPRAGLIVGGIISSVATLAVVAAQGAVQLPRRRTAAADADG